MHDSTELCDAADAPQHEKVSMIVAKKKISVYLQGTFQAQTPRRNITSSMCQFFGKVEEKKLIRGEAMQV